MVSVYSRREDAMLPRLSISQQDDEIIVEPCIAKNQVARIGRFLLMAGEVSGRFGLPANGQWTFEGIIEATDEETTALQGAGYQLRDLRTKSLSNLLEELSGDRLRHKSCPRQIVLFDEVFVEKEWAGPLANERRERAKADDQASVLMRALAEERANTDEQVRALAEERADVKRLNSVLSNERDARRRAWLCWTLTVIITVITMVFLYIR
jgi:predicted nucleic acid-binding Zn ribbon protein